MRFPMVYDIDDALKKVDDLIARSDALLKELRN